jgi:hypothetical protein
MRQLLLSIQLLADIWYWAISTALSSTMPAKRPFEDHITRTDSCWLWDGTHTARGYGEFRIARRKTMAHRIAWERAFGSIPDGLCVLHECDVTRCVNPNHLFLGTRVDNAKDRDAKGRRRGVSSSNGTHLSTLRCGLNHWGSKIRTVTAVHDIRARCATGERQKDVGERYGVTQRTISLIVRREQWGDIA